MQSTEQNGTVHLKSTYTAAETLNRLRDLLVDEHGLPVDFTVTAGQANDCTQAILSLARAQGRSCTGRQRI